MNHDHWLARPRTLRRRLWQAFIGVLVLTIVAEMAIVVHPHFAVESWFGFNALYGFLACAALILIAKGLGVLLKRRDDYYAD